MDKSPCAQLQKAAKPVERSPFMVILGAASILLICYDGYDKQDSIVCTLAGIFGLCICLFPCGAAPNLALVGTFQLSVRFSGRIHNISAVIFFALLAYNSYFLFTKFCCSIFKLSNAFIQSSTVASKVVFSNKSSIYNSSTSISFSYNGNILLL